jgi:hypothetical protein
MKIFYEGVPHNDLEALPNGAEFIAIYSPAQRGGEWQKVRFKVMLKSSLSESSRPDYQHLETIPMTPEEIAHYERLLDDL